MLIYCNVRFIEANILKRDGHNSKLEKKTCKDVYFVDVCIIHFNNVT